MQRHDSVLCSRSTGLRHCSETRPLITCISDIIIILFIQHNTATQQRTSELNRSFWRRSSQPISWLVLIKINLTQQKQTFIRNTKILPNKITTKKLKPGLVAGRLVQSIAWKLSCRPCATAPRAHMAALSQEIGWEEHIQNDLFCVLKEQNLMQQKKLKDILIFNSYDS